MHIKKTIYFLLLVLLTSCLSHDEIVNKQDSDLTSLSELSTKHMKSLLGRTIKKTISIDNQTETSTLEVDSSFIKSEFTKTVDLDIEKVFLNGEYEKSVSDLITTYKHRNEKTTAPIQLDIIKDTNGTIVSHRIKYNNSNYLFDSEFDFLVQSKNSTIVSYRIDAYQKLIGMDATKYSIEGEGL